MIELSAIGAPAFTVEVLPENRFRYASVNAAKLAQTGLSAGALIGAEPDAVHPPSLAARLCRAFGDCAAKRALVEYEASGEARGGSAAWRTWLTPLFGIDGAVTALLGISQDLGDAQASERGWKSAAENLSIALQSLKGAEWHCEGAAGRIVASDGFALLMGEAAPRAVTWDEWRDHVHPHDWDAAFGDPWGGGDVRQYRFWGRDGALRWARCTRVAVKDEAGRPVRMSGAVVDITDERRREERLQEMAMRDALTGLLNRRGLRQAVDRASADWPPDATVALFMVDLDDFKATNDTFGHAAGDAVLAETARRLVAVLGRGALCSRLGGDEFVAVRPVSGPAEAKKIQTLLTDALSRPVEPSGAGLPLSASVGLSIRSGISDFACLMAAADAQLYARKAGRRPEPFRGGARAA